MTMPCNSNCDCRNIKYDPVCYEPLGLTFYSACHAGCSASIVQNDIKVHKPRGYMSTPTTSCFHSFVVLIILPRF